MGRTLNMMSGKDSSRRHATHSKSATYVPPKLGTTSKSKKIEKRAWEQEMGLTQTAPPAIETSSASSHDQQLLEAITTLQHKYEENLQVIEQLYKEKKDMAKKVEILEYKLQKSVSPTRPRKPSPVPPRYSKTHGRNIASENHKLNKTTSTNPRYPPEVFSDDERYDQSESQSQLNVTSPAVLQHLRNLTDEDLLQGGDQSVPETPIESAGHESSKALSALQAAEMFTDEPPVVTSRSARSLPTRSVYEPRVNQNSKIRPSSAPKRDRYSVPDSPPRGRRSTTSARTLSRSSSARRSGPSTSLQADTDRFAPFTFC